MWFSFQFNLSDSSDDDLYRLDLDPEGQGHQWKIISIVYTWDHILTRTQTLTLTAVKQYVDPPINIQY